MLPGSAIIFDQYPASFITYVLGLFNSDLLTIVCNNKYMYMLLFLLFFAAIGAPVLSVIYFKKLVLGKIYFEISAVERLEYALWIKGLY